MMTLEQFEENLDLYGSDLSIWPDHLAQAADGLLKSSSAAQHALEDARLLDATLDAYTIDAPSAAFEASLLDLAPKASVSEQQQKGGIKSWFSLRLVTTATAALACAAFGFVIGIQSINSIQMDKEADAFVSASLDGTSYTDEFWTGEEG